MLTKLTKNKSNELKIVWGSWGDDAMAAKKRKQLLPAFILLTLSGCGTYVPQMQEIWDTSKIPILTAGGQLELRIKEKVYCDIVQAVNDNIDILPYKWGVQVTLDLQVDETGAINPGISFINPLPASQSFTTGLGATFSSQGTREDKFGNYWNVDKLRHFNGGTCQQDRQEWHGSSPLLESELGISRWLSDQLITNEFIPSSPVSKNAEASFKQDVLSYHVKFVVISGGNATPTWKLDDRFHEPDHGTGDLLVDSSFAVR
jgi:hypothetical protein